MSTVSDLNAVLARDVHWQIAYPAVAGIIRNYLTSWKGDPLTSTALAEALWPAAEVKDPIQKIRRNRLFRAMRKVSEHELSDWLRPTGENTFYMGRKIDVYRWFDPQRSPTGASVADKYRAIFDAAMASVGEIRRAYPALENDRMRLQPALLVLESVLARLEKAIAL